MPIKDVQVEELSPGNAPSIVLLHAAGTSGWMWRALAQDLAREFHVLIPDLPGHGRSSQLPWQSIGRTADLVRALIEERGHGGTAHVIGLSLGGYVGS